MTCAYDPVWDEIYARGHQQRAPWDSVVTFLFRNAPKNKHPEEVRVLEVGCGTASNLIFAAQRGFSVTGVDASASAIAVARERFARDGLSARLEICDFTHLPFSNAEFDLIIDRGAITCSPFEGTRKNIEEGTLTGVGHISFYGLSDIAALLDQSAWRILQLRHMEWFDCLLPRREMHAEYRIVAERNAIGKPTFKA
jgi:SAM-dependent methyltransferase